MDVQFFKTPSGEEMVVLSKADYEALVRIAEEAAEDAADVAAFDAAMAAPNGLEQLPFEVSQHILKGTGLLKALRLWRDVGQVKLADDIGTSQGFISDLESGRRKMTEEVASKLATALDIPLRWLV